MRYAVIARDPQIDIYRESDLYGVEIVEAMNEESAIEVSTFANLQGLFIVSNKCADDMELGECDLQDIHYE